MPDTQVYWAAEPTSAELVRRATERVSRHLGRMRQMGRLAKARALLSTSYGYGTDGQTRTDALQGKGPEGNVLSWSVNLVRPILDNVLSLIAGQRPGIKPVPTNTDATSGAQTRMADELRGYYERKLDLANLELDVVRGGLRSSSWWLVQGWRPDMGSVMGMDPETGRLAYEGDVECFSLPFWRVAHDMTARREVDRQWVIFRRAMNRHDLCATYPRCAQHLIEGVTGREDWGKRLGEGDDTASLDAMFNDVIDNEDAVWVWELRHRPSPALPEGRLVRFVDEQTVFFDSYAFVPPDAPYDAAVEPQRMKYPYDPKELHAIEWAPERVVGTANGHAPGFDLLGAQELQDICTASMATTLNVLGTPHMWMGPMGEGNKAPTYPLGNSGIMALEGPNPPQVVDFPALKAEVVEAFKTVRSVAAEMVSLNNVVQGRPDKGMPAQAMALMRAQAVQFHQAAQGEYVRLVERNVTGVLRLLQAFASSPRVAEIAGKSGEWRSKEWRKKDIAGVARFQCEAINPMTLSYESRVALAETMAGKDWIDREGFMAIYQTGDLREKLDSVTSSRDLIAANKDLLRQGIGLPPVDMQATMQAQDEAMQAAMADPTMATDPSTVGPVFADDGKEHVRLLKTDPHWVAYNEYKSVLDSPSARENPAVVEAVLGVLQETLRLWASLTPDEVAAAQGTPLPSQMAMTAPTSTTGIPGGGETTSTGMPEGGETSSTMPKPDGPRLPKPPPDPITDSQQGTESLGGLSA